MKILQINTSLNKAAPGRIAENIGLLIRENNWESYIAHGKVGNPSASVSIRIGSNIDIYIHALGTRLTDRHAFFSRRATIKLVKTIMSIKPDLVHLHNIHGYYVNIEVLFNYLSSANIPIVWTLHDCWSFTGHCTHFESVCCDQWKTQCVQCIQKGEYPKSFIDNCSMNFTDKLRLFTSVKKMTIVPVSIWLESKVKDSFLGEYPTKVITNGVDLNVFSTQVEKLTSLSNKAIILGVASVWSEKKGLYDFIKLNNIIDKSKYQIVLVGLSKKQMQKMPNDIICITHTNSIEELAKYYSSSLVFVNPTYEDTFPTTNLESLASGTPIITYRTGGSPEAVDCHTGFVVDKGDISAIYERINFLYYSNNKEFYRQMCRCRAEKYYNQQVNYHEYIQLYEELIDVHNL